MYRILFVCTGNTCRSPMAEAMLRRKVAQESLSERIHVTSAGLSAWEGERASAEAIQVMRQKGLTLDLHRARLLQGEMLSSADLVLTMAESHRTQILRRWETVAGKVWVWGDYVNLKGDVADPFGGTILDYERCAEMLQRLMEYSWGKFTQAAGEKRLNDEK
jgi:protein-tyrosine-phosphatase